MRKFIGVFALLVLMWTTGSWLQDMCDWIPRGFSQATWGQVVGSLAGQGMITFAALSQMWLWKQGAKLPRRSYIWASCCLIGAGSLSLAVALLVLDHDAHVENWIDFLPIGLTVVAALGGLSGLAHCALLARKARKEA